MQSSLINKIEKARRYAEERDRITVHDLSCEVRGDNGTHTASLHDGAWRCDCHFFRDNDTCSHTMALQRIFAGMLSESAGTFPGVS